MKNTIVLILLAMGLAACASSQTTGSGDAATADGGETTARKKVCKRDRSARVGTRVRRSCKYVDEIKAPDDEN